MKLNQNRMMLDYSEYSDRELALLLDTALEQFGPHDRIDRDIVPLLDEWDRRSGRPAPAFDAQAGWEALKDGHPLFFKGTLPESNPPMRGRRRRFGILAAAVVLASLLFGTVAAQASGVDILGSVVRWTRDTFYLEHPDTSEAPAQSRLDSLNALIQADGVDLPLVPSWLPDGMTMTELSSSKNELGIEYYAVYANETDSLSISISDLDLGDNVLIYEKNDEDFIVYEAGGMEHYIVGNMDTITAVWLSGPYECSIATTLPVEVVEKIIDSIYE